MEQIRPILGLTWSKIAWHPQHISMYQIIMSKILISAPRQELNRVCVIIGSGIGPCPPSMPYPYKSGTECCSVATTWSSSSCGTSTKQSCAYASCSLGGKNVIIKKVLP